MRWLMRCFSYPMSNRSIIFNQQHRKCKLSGHEQERGWIEAKANPFSTKHWAVVDIDVLDLSLRIQFSVMSDNMLLLSFSNVKAYQYVVSLEWYEWKLKLISSLIKMTAQFLRSLESLGKSRQIVKTRSFSHHTWSGKKFCVPLFEVATEVFTFFFSKEKNSSNLSLFGSARATPLEFLLVLSPTTFFNELKFRCKKKNLRRKRKILKF